MTFEEWWYDYAAKKLGINARPEPDEHARAAFEAATKAALGSRVVLPERMDENSGGDGDSFLFEQGFNDCLDQIKLIPLTAEQLLPSDDSLKELANKKTIELLEDQIPAELFAQFDPKDSEYIYKFIFNTLLDFRDCIKKRLGGV